MLIIKRNIAKYFASLLNVGLLCLVSFSACSSKAEFSNYEFVGCWVAKGVSPYKDVIQVFDTGKFSQTVMDKDVEVFSTVNGTWYRQKSLDETYIVFYGVAISYSFCLESEFACGFGAVGDVSPWRKTSWPVLPTYSPFNNSWKLIVSDDTGHFYEKKKCPNYI